MLTSLSCDEFSSCSLDLAALIDAMITSVYHSYMIAYNAAIGKHVKTQTPQVIHQADHSLIPASMLVKRKSVTKEWDARYGCI